MAGGRRILSTAALCVATFALVAYAHEDEHTAHGDSGHGMDMGHEASSASPPAAIAAATDPETPHNYFSFPEHKALLYAHILTMVVAWVFVMPIATMLQVAGSRYHLPIQLVFLLTNGVGIVLSTIYNNLTPDLYPGNSHHKLGWTIVWFLSAQAIAGVLGAVVRRSTSHSWSSKEERSGFIPVATQSPGDGGEAHLYRHSGDSGHAMSMDSPTEEHLNFHAWDATIEEKPAKRWFNLEKLEDILSKRAPSIFNERVLQICDFIYSLVARSLIVLGFVQLCLGVIAASGIFMGNDVFNGLAHFIKGGIFFMYGVLVLGRYTGAFANLGWAWNIKPSSNNKWISSAPSAEMVESGLLFTYGVTNVFLEHLAAWGGAWTHSDLQHASIAFLLFGGGLCGMLIESRRVRDLLNSSVALEVTPTPSITNSYGNNIAPLETQPPSSYAFSFNPLPALTIFLVGILMSSHHQHSALSTKIHVQWGSLLAGASIFRILTYMLFYRAPPSSYFPSRPPTEILTAFLLMSGGLVFMCSNRPTVNYLEGVGVDAMFTLVVTVGFTTLIMSWITIVMAIKGWALRKEQKRLFTTRFTSVSA